MRRALRPAFIATSVVVLASCTRRPLTNPPHPGEDPIPSASSESDAANAADAAGGAEGAEATRRKKFGVHPRDSENHLIFRRSAGTCYVQVPNSKPPPKDLMSGERWVEDKDVTCPKEFGDPAFAAIADGSYWIQDEATGACSQATTVGNPPPPPVNVPCPPVLAKKK